MTNAKNHILIISIDPLYEKLAGPGIRVVEMARYLAPHCHVVLAAPSQADVHIPDVTCVAFQPGDQAAMKLLASQADVIILQGFTLHHYPCIAEMQKIIVVDMYDPFHLEGMEYFKNEHPDQRQQAMMSTIHVVNELLKTGDFFLCASERQRDFWSGALSSVGRLTPESYLRDATFQSLITVVPFGIDPNPPIHQKHVLKGIVPGITEQDIVVLWGGGMWDWLDPITIVRAMDIVRHERTDIKLFFLGSQHPNPVDVPKMRVYDQVTTLIQELHLEQTVFLNDHWVDYHERANYFLEADIGISAHLEHVETRFAFRTRVLDYIWSGLPMVVAQGDTLADMVEERGLGHTVAIGDIAGFAQAILTMAAKPALRKHYAPAFAMVQQEFAWPVVLKPLIAYCQDPRSAADKNRLTLVDSYQQTLAERHAVINEKNEHIAYLEDLIRKVESGKVMRLLRWLSRT